MPTTLVAVTCGYVESSYCSWLFFRAFEPFDTGIDALQNLAHGLLLMYVEDGHVRSQLDKKRCCKEFLERKQEGDQYCPVCRSQIGPSFDLEHFQQWLCSKHHDTADDWGGEFDGVCQWWPWPTLDEILNTPQDQILSIPEHGEIKLSMALRGDELPNNADYVREINDLWKGIQNSTDDWDRKHGWDGSREAFARQLDDTKQGSHEHRLPPRA